MSNHFLKFLTAMLFFSPAIAFAATGTFVNDLIADFGIWLRMTGALLIGIAVLVFFWGIIKYVIAGSTNEEGKRDARNLMIYGVIGLFVMVAVWGIVYFIASVIGVDVGGRTEIPDLPGGSFTSTLPKSTLAGIIDMFGGWIAGIAVTLIGVAVITLFWGVIKFIGGASDEEKRAEGKRVMTYGIVGLFVMIAIWGVVYLIGGTLGLAPGTNANIPQIDATGIEIIKGGGGTPTIPAAPAVTATGQAMTTCADAIWPATKSFKSIVCLVLNLLEPLPAILIGLAVLFFFWGIVKYINSAGDGEKLKEGRNMIIYGVIGIFVLVAVWALVILVKSELGL